MKIAPIVLLLASGIAVSADASLLIQDGSPPQSPPAVSPATTPASSAISSRASFLISDSRMHSDPEVFWPGFLNGLRGFECFYDPVGSPLYFEKPFNDTSVKLLYLHHEFGSDSVLQGGDLDVYAVQVRLALTERLGFIATKDGYSDLNADALPQDEGWNDVAFGLKYAFYVDRESDMVATFGGRYMMGNGDAQVLQGGVQEFSPFISIAKGWDKFHLIGNLTDRIPLDNDKGNNVLQWDIHADYEVLDGVAPMLEIHGLHYLDDGTRTPLSIGGADYSNLGSTNVSGSTVIWAGAGARAKLSPHLSVGATYEYPLTNKDADIFGSRVTVDVTLVW